MDEENDEQHERSIQTWIRAYRPYLSILEAVLGWTPAGPLFANRLRELTKPPKDPLAERAKAVTAALTLSAELLEDLQAEVKAKIALIDGLEARTLVAEGRASDAEIRAALNEEQAKAVDSYLDRAVKHRIGELERSARRREWGLATVVALAVGVASILLSHYLFSF
ncbi:hypothetical protein KGQ19_18175 [Catenulispora sp. NL8]|uniref:Uncharacterized protein n=1 Tax=Catenulispora pinistramenti TaxID=2705254 RepID=A0ABS5KRX4_9ACTN|nr:hypothetical protein [Catenulispora pinistramenti]MBS2548796.1 hypothetical protein [Catenulispora pinistramenti]